MTRESIRLDFVPGTLCDERMWQRLTPLLDAVTAAAVDYRHVPLPAARTRAQMRTLIAEHSAPQANIVAFSLGTYLTLEHALAHPGRVRSLVLIANSARGLSDTEIQTRRRIAVMLAKNAYTGMSAARLRELLHPSHLGNPDIAGVIERMALDLGKDVLLAQFEATLEREDLMDRLGEITCPVLIVGSPGDKLVPAEALAAMHARFPDSRLHMVENAGHMVPLEAPEELARLIGDFLRQIGSAAEAQ